MFGKKPTKIIAGHAMTEKEYKYLKTEYEHYIINRIAKEIHPVAFIKQILYDYDDEIYKSYGKFNTDECIKYFIEHAEFKTFEEWLVTDFISQDSFYITPEWDKDRERRNETLTLLQDKISNEIEKKWFDKE